MSKTCLNTAEITLDCGNPAVIEKTTDPSKPSSMTSVVVVGITSEIDQLLTLCRLLPLRLIHDIEVGTE